MNAREMMNDSRPLLLDGAMGTLLMNRLPGYTGCIELLNLERPDLVLEIHRAYAESGALIITTNTFGGGGLKLSEYGLAERVRDINGTAVRLAKESVAGKDALVAGCIGPSGRLLEPAGTVSAAEMSASFTEQAAVLAESGVDMFVIETMGDLLEAQTALRAVRSVSSLPLVCNLTFENNGKTVSGTDMFTGLATLSQSGADVVGANCSMGPEGLLKLFRENMDRLETLGVPLSVWANAGLPEIIDGRAGYSLSPERFAALSVEFALMGMKIIGGCCGTTPAHIGALAKLLENVPSKNRAYRKRYSFITSRFTAVDAGSRDELIVIGERLNPTARKKFAEELKIGANGFLREESKKQEAEGARVLDINVGVPGIDETAAMASSVKLLGTLVKTPLMVDSDNPGVLEAALAVYPGTAIVNSINGKEKSLRDVLPLLHRFGAFVVALCLDDSGIHREASRRISIGEAVLKRLEDEGIDPDRVFVDPLMLAESAEPGAAMETLKVIEHFASRGVKTSLGISNISFGLPMRKHINNAFLRLARRKGLSAAIVNPAALETGDAPGEEESLALDFLSGADPGASKYIARFQGAAAKTAEPSPPGKQDPSKNPLSSIYSLVVDGNDEAIGETVRQALKDHRPDTVMNEGLIRGLERVGELYNTGEYFLPQMIASANAMKAGFQVLKPLLARAAERSLGRIVICTVQGDVHDIGKNIVALMMENHGFEVIDLGKDVPAEKVLTAVREHRPDILCLSSLLTTTMHQMKVLSGLLRSESPAVKLLVGGAVVTADYAESIGAAYAEDAVRGVEEAKKLVKKG
ncbi:MAG TPA: 5-methyltetrahydrofolate--homocysteine methyltransferase [Spirochaetes bacterium]|nr:5-methyltetrahydrofolate--homocysteine methyltransferase [Spirochaetota bacterium]